MSPWAQVPTCYAFEAVSQSIGTLAAIVNAHRFLCVLSSNVNETFPQLNPHICVTYGKLGLTCFELCVCVSHISNRPDRPPDRAKCKGIRVKSSEDCTKLKCFDRSKTKKNKKRNVCQCLGNQRLRIQKRMTKHKHQIMIWPIEINLC